MDMVNPRRELGGPDDTLIRATMTVHVEWPNRLLDYLRNQVRKGGRSANEASWLLMNGPGADKRPKVDA